MDSLIAAAARAFAKGDVIGTLQHVGQRDDPPALALRGVAMAQLGEYVRAQELLRRAAQGFGTREAVSRARCVVALAEVSLTLRDLTGSDRPLRDAVAVLDTHGDTANVQHARLLMARRLLLQGRLDEVLATLSALDGQALPPALQAVAEQVQAEVALRQLRMTTARAALQRATRAAVRAGRPALLREVADAQSALQATAARRLDAGQDPVPLRLDEVAAYLQNPTVLVVDGLRHRVGHGDTWLPLARRPILFALAHALGSAWPRGLDRKTLIERVFRTRRPDDTHRARLRVEMGRLRRLLEPFAQVLATANGYTLVPHDQRAVVVLAPPVEGDQAALLALLSDGLPWSSSALSVALATSQRTVQRALVELEAERRVVSTGRGRTQRWLAPPVTGFTTILLLPASLPIT